MLKLTTVGSFKMAKIYAEQGINWMFVYEAQYEDDDIVILKDLGRFHRYDEERMFKGTVDAWIEIRNDVLDDGRLVQIV